MSGRKSEVLAFSLVSGINVAMVRLADIWDSIGIMEDQRVERMQTVKKHIEGLLNQMISEEEYLKQRIGNDITTFQKQLEILSQEMSMEPFEFEEGLTVLQTEKSLRLRVEALEKERSGRLEELRSLQRQDEDLCQELNASVYYVPAGSLPTGAELQELRGHVQSLSEEKRSRVVVFSGLREDIRLVMGQMGHEPETSLEEDAVCDDADVFLLTHENINALQLLLCQLEMKRKSLTALRDELEAKAVCLWRRLECPEQEQREFHHNLHGTLSDKITQWQIELDGLSMLQKARLEEVTEKIRLELVEAWDRCMFSPKQREPFNIHFCSGNLTEELLSRHDEELLQVKTFYEKARPLLEAVEMWNKNWVLFQDFEKKASDPNRFSNRGGTLLKEAKERVRVQKLLPKLEEELKTSVEAWEKEYGTVFLVWGQRATDYITGQLEEHQQQRGKEKNERMTKKGENTLLKAQSKRSQTGVTGGMTPSKTRKMPNQTMVRTNSFSWASPSGTSLSVSVKSTPSSQKKNRTLDVSSRTPLQEFSSAKKHTEISSYSVFTSTLSKKGSRDAVLNSTAKNVL